jgi:hypothetical protein
MGRKVDVEDLVDTQDVARMLGLAHRNTVSEYQVRYDDMPRPVVDLGRGRSKLGCDARFRSGRTSVRTTFALAAGPPRPELPASSRPAY